MTSRPGVETCPRRDGDQRPKVGLVAVKRLGAALLWLIAALDASEFKLQSRVMWLKEKPPEQGDRHGADRRSVRALVPLAHTQGEGLKGTVGSFEADKDKKGSRGDIARAAGNKGIQGLNDFTKPPEVDERGLEQEWDIGHGLQGLADTPIACESNQVISLFEKGHGHIRCLEMDWGYSTQVDTKVHELENVKALKRMSATCPAGHGLRSIAAEASDKGAWIRLRSRFAAGGKTRGIVACGGFSEYVLNTRELGSLTYDKFQGKWCVSGKNCAFSDIVHPLDTMMKTDEWQVVAVSDFDAVFEARGVKPLHSNKKRSPPPLIKFGASDPEYLPECKDESHPGTRTFKLELMNKEAESLDDENACKYVYGKPPKDQAGDGADGMYGWIDDLVSNLGPGQGGVTYKSVKECWGAEV
ncbi:Uncharacterized protein SCF082_LOCUS13146 [Durusdinium trenchii]|uniref:Uncharacterized protein n=1 Tax=Durusdinium trenchii TaxID=1381693 RepID=A0ABP0JPH6_9DINO